MAGIGVIKKLVMGEQYLGQLAPSTNWLAPIVIVGAGHIAARRFDSDLYELPALIRHAIGKDLVK